MEEIIESYQDFINEGFIKMKHFGVNFTITSKIDAGQRKAKYNFLPSTMKDLELIEDKENFAKTIETYLNNKSGLKFVYDAHDPAAGMTFSIYLVDLEEVMIHVLK